MSPRRRTGFDCTRCFGVETIRSHCAYCTGASEGSGRRGWPCATSSACEGASGSPDNGGCNGAALRLLGIRHPRGLMRQTDQWSETEGWFLRPRLCNREGGWPCLPPSRWQLAHWNRIERLLHRRQKDLIPCWNLPPRADARGKKPGATIGRRGEPLVGLPTMWNSKSSIFLRTLVDWAKD